MEKKIKDFVYSHLNCNAIEIHYGLTKGKTSIDAFTLNSSEKEFISVLKEIASAFETRIWIETEPKIGEEIVRWYRIVSRHPSVKDFVGAILMMPIATHIFSNHQLELTEKSNILSVAMAQLHSLSQGVKDDPTLEELQVKAFEEVIAFFEKNIERYIDAICISNVVSKRRSNFYKELRLCRRMDRVSFILIGDCNTEIVQNAIYKNSFTLYILKTDQIDPITDEEAVIDIVSPVLKNGAYKWRGFYKGEPISFSLLSEEFKSNVLSGKIEFKSGTTINCKLQIERKLKHNGDIKITNYSILLVNSYYEKDMNVVETFEGKRYKAKKQIERSMPTLFDDF